MARYSIYQYSTIFSTCSLTRILENRLNARVVGYFELFSVSKDPSVRFYALQQLKELLAPVAARKGGALSVSDCQVLRGKYVVWLQHNVGSYAAEPLYLKNYVAVVYALLLKVLFPERWSTAFQDVLEIADKGHAGGVELFLRVLLYVDEEVVAPRNDRLSSAEAEHNTVIKDAMRVSSLQQIVDMWYSVFIVCRNRRPDLVRTCLEVASEYVGWIDISLTVNDRIIPMLYYFLAKESFRIDATKVLYEIIAKGMPENAKLELLRHLDILEILKQLCIAQSQESSPLHARAVAFEAKMSGVVPIYGKSWSFEPYEDDYSEEDQDQTFMETLAEMTNLVCTELLMCGSALQEDPASSRSVAEELSKSMDLLIYHFLAHQDIKVQGKVEEYRTCLLHCVVALQCPLFCLGANHGFGFVCLNTIYSRLLNFGFKGCTLEFIGRMVTAARAYKQPKDSGKSDPSHTLGKLYLSFIPKMLPVLMRSMCFPATYTFELENETDAIFESHRKNLRKIFVNISRFAAVDVVIPFLQVSFLRSPTLIYIFLREVV